MAAFAAGSCRDVVASIYVSALFGLVFAYVAVHLSLERPARCTGTWICATAARLSVAADELAGERVSGVRDIAAKVTAARACRRQLFSGQGHVG
jgi:hypothetical protein